MNALARKLVAVLCALAALRLGARSAGRSRLIVENRCVAELDAGSDRFDRSGRSRDSCDHRQFERADRRLISQA